MKYIIPFLLLSINLKKNVWAVTLNHHLKPKKVWEDDSIHKFKSNQSQYDYWREKGHKSVLYQHSSIAVIEHVRKHLVYESLLMD